jgi:hypothetical protein
MPYLTLVFATGWRHHLWLALLQQASPSHSALPAPCRFAAFGAVAAMTLSSRSCRYHEISRQDGSLRAKEL